MQISTLAENAAVNAVTALCNAGTPPGFLNIFTGSHPTNTTDANTGTFLAQCTLANTAFPTASGGTANTTNIGSNTNIAANGTAGYYRLTDSSNVVVSQGSVGTANADLIVNSTAFTVGATFAMTYFSITQLAGT